MPFALTAEKKTDHPMRISRLIYLQNFFGFSFYIRFSKAGHRPI